MTKKLIALLAALALTVCVSMTAFADTTNGGVDDTEVEDDGDGEPTEPDEEPDETEEPELEENDGSGEPVGVPGASAENNAKTGVAVAIIPAAIAAAAVVISRKRK